jgi:hypothetical protein
MFALPRSTDHTECEEVEGCSASVHLDSDRFLDWESEFMGYDDKAAKTDILEENDTNESQLGQDHENTDFRDPQSQGESSYLTAASVVIKQKAKDEQHQRLEKGHIMPEQRERVTTQVQLFMQSFQECENDILAEIALEDEDTQVKLEAQTMARQMALLKADVEELTDQFATESRKWGRSEKEQLLANKIESFDFNRAKNLTRRLRIEREAREERNIREQETRDGGLQEREIRERETREREIRERQVRDRETREREFREREVRDREIREREIERAEEERQRQRERDLELAEERQKRDLARDLGRHGPEAW